MSEVKKTDHSADVLASIRSQVPTAVDYYLGTKLDDALLKVLERHTADLIEKYSVLPGPEFVKNQESEKSPKEIIRAKKEQDEEKQDSTYSIRSTDKVDLEEFDLKSALFSHMNKKKSANKNTTNYRLYHALMEALIADEDAMDKEVADKVKDHKRKHDSDDDEDDDDVEVLSTGSNQGRSTKRRRSDSAASGSAKPPPKADDQSSKKPRESEASASKQHPTLTSTGWQITDTRDAGADSSMHRSDPESEHSEQSSDDISKQDEGNDSAMEDTDNAHIPKVSTLRKEEALQAEFEVQLSTLLKTFIRTSSFFISDDLDYLLTGDKERKITLSISKLKAARYLDFGLEELVPSLWVESERRILTYSQIADANSQCDQCQGHGDSGSESEDEREEAGLHHCNREMTTDQRIYRSLGQLWKGECTKGQTMHFTLSGVISRDPRINSLIFHTGGNQGHILRVLRIILVILPEHPSETIVFHNEDGNPARANIKQALVEELTDILKMEMEMEIRSTSDIK
ncbi:hypothetical protein Tco_0905080 [Tanacetum coccineum]